MTVIFADPPRQAEVIDVVHQEHTPVLLLGQSSSGTSICSAILREHLRVSFGTESQFMAHYGRSVGQYGDLSKPDNFERLLDDVLQERWFERVDKFGYRADRRRILDRVERRTLSGLLDAIFLDLAEHQGMTRWGDKSPEYLANLPVLKQLFPDARYLHLVRDGRDVALSHFGRHWGPKNIVAAALDWQGKTRLVREFLASLPSEQSLEIRYEDLLARPADVVRQLIPFLRIDDPLGELADEIGPRVDQDVKSDNFDKWRTRMNPRQIAAFDAIAADELTFYGYDCKFRQSTHRPSPAEQWLWRNHSRLVNLTHREQWSENWYRGNLRLRYLGRKLLRRAR